MIPNFALGLMFYFLLKLDMNFLILVFGKLFSLSDNPLYKRAY